MGGGPFLGPAAPFSGAGCLANAGAWPLRRALLQRREIIGRIDRRRALAQLEVQLRRGDVAALAGFGDGLAARDLIAALDRNVAIMRIGGHEAIGMTDEHQIAISLELAAGISDHSGTSAALT